MLFDVVERVQEQRRDFIIVFCVFTWTGRGKCAPYYTADRTGDCKHRESGVLTMHFNSEYYFNNYVQTV